MANLSDEVPIPAADGMNTGKFPCPTNMLITRYGRPVSRFPENCTSNRASSPFWRGRFVTEDVGPFRVTGHRLAVGLLRQALAAVKIENPTLYAELGTAGMLCIRHVRGHPGVPSNHALGLAIDFTVSGRLDDYGDGMTQLGMLQLYQILKRFGWYWGAEFRKEDSMHFEVCSETVMEWVRQGIF